MILQRAFLLAVILAGCGVFVRHASATNIIAESPMTSRYDFKQDPYLLEWSFALTKSKNTVVSTETPSLEEKILNRWKEKQAHLWNKLPEESFTINASAYTASADECGKSDGVTASGLKVTKKQTLACPPSFPFGTRMSIEGMGEFRCEDRGGAIKGNKIDIYMETKQEAFVFGRQNLTAQVIH